MKTVVEKLNFRPPVKRYKVGEVASFSGLSRQTVHNYTIMGLISESDWSQGGHRLYEEGVFVRLAYIEQLKKNKTLRQIREMLAEYDRMGRPLELKANQD